MRKCEATPKPPKRHTVRIIVDGVEYRPNKYIARAIRDALFWVKRPNRRK